MATQTTNLNLTKPAGNENADIGVINTNMDLIDGAVENKVEKVTGKSLSTNDYTTAEKTKLTGIATGATANTVLNATATITTTWVGTTAPYTQDVTVSGLLATDTPIIDLVETTQSDILEEDWNKIYRIVAGAGKITVYTKEKTTVSIPIKIRTVR